MKGVREEWGFREDGAFSRESLLVRGAPMPRDLERVLVEMDRLYYRWIPRLTADWVEIVPEEGGGQAARVVPIGPTGLRLGPPRIEGSRIERPILEGWLVSEPSGTLAQELVPREEGVEAAVHLRAFKPRVPTLLYERTQEVIHRRLSRGYLRHVVAPLLRSLS